MERLFCYGTLRPSLYPGKADAFDLTPIGRGRLVGGFKMLHLGGFPGLVKTAEEKAIVGEISEVENLNGLDRYEGYPSLYVREKVSVELEDGSKMDDVWVYLFNEEDHEAEEIESGDWADAIKARRG